MSALAASWLDYVTLHILGAKKSDKKRGRRKFKPRGLNNLNLRGLNYLNPPQELHKNPDLPYVKNFF